MSATFFFFFFRYSLNYMNLTKNSNAVLPSVPGKMSDFPSTMQQLAKTGHHKCFFYIYIIKHCTKERRGDEGLKFSLGESSLRQSERIALQKKIQCNKPPSPLLPLV